MSRACSTTSAAKKGVAGGGDLMKSYYVYSAVLALKLLSLSPIANFVCNPDMVKRANVSDLKNLTPFWLLAALYITTTPDRYTAMTLIRVYVAARFIAAAGYLTQMPKCVNEAAFFLSFCITSFMGASVVYAYRKFL